jgi:hypothetical protein
MVRERGPEFIDCCPADLTIRKMELMAIKLTYCLEDADRPPAYFFAYAIT